MPTITVTFADGSKNIYENVPESVTADQAEQRARQDFPSRQITELHREAGRFEAVLGKGKKVLSDMARGALNSPVAQVLQGAILANPGTGLAMKATGADKLPMTVADAQKALPARQAGYGTAAAEGLGEFAVNPVGGLAGATGAVAGNLGGEVSAKLLGEGPLQRGLGALVGGTTAAGAVGRLGRLSANTPQLAKEALEGITEQQMRAAQDLMARAQQQGASMDLAQALEAVGGSAGNLTTIRNVLANNKAGDEVQRTLRAQPSALSVMSDMQVARMPGTVYGEAQAANNLQETATAAIDGARKARTAAVQPMYEAAGALSTQFRRQFADELSEALQKPGLTEQTAATVQDALAKLKALPATKAPMEMAADYDELIRSMRGPFKGNPMTPQDPRTKGQLGGLTDKLTDLLRNSSGETKAAAARYAQISQDVVDPLKQGPVGQLATKRGYLADTQASTAKMRQLFEAGVDPQVTSRNSPIRTAARELAKVDKEAFADAAKTYYSAKVAEAFDPVIKGAPAMNMDAAQRLFDSMFKDQKRYQGMKDTVAEVARTYGQDPAQAVRGLENYAQIVKALKNTTKVGGLAREEVLRLGGRNYGADALRVFGFLPFERAARRLEDRTMSNAFHDFDKLITTPEGVATLAQLSKKSFISKEALTMLGMVQGAAGSASVGANSPDVN